MLIIFLLIHYLLFSVCCAPSSSSVESLLTFHPPLRHELSQEIQTCISNGQLDISTLCPHMRNLTFQDWNLAFLPKCVSPPQSSALHCMCPNHPVVQAKTSVVAIDCFLFCIPNIYSSRKSYWCSLQKLSPICLPLYHHYHYHLLPISVFQVFPMPVPPGNLFSTPNHDLSRTQIKVSHFPS